MLIKVYTSIQPRDLNRRSQLSFDNKKKTRKKREKAAKTNYHLCIWIRDRTKFKPKQHRKKKLLSSKLST